MTKSFDRQVFDLEQKLKKMEKVTKKPSLNRKVTNAIIENTRDMRAMMIRKAPKKTGELRRNIKALSQKEALKLSAGRVTKIIHRGAIGTTFVGAMVREEWSDEHKQKFAIKANVQEYGSDKRKIPAKRYIVSSIQAFTQKNTGNVIDVILDAIGDELISG